MQKRNKTSYGASRKPIDPNTDLNGAYKTGTNIYSSQEGMTKASMGQPEMTSKSSNFGFGANFKVSACGVPRDEAAI